MMLISPFLWHFAMYCHYRVSLLPELYLSRPLLPGRGFPAHNFVHFSLTLMRICTKIYTEKVKYNTIQQAHNVLNSGGVLMIDLMFDENVDSFWWTSLCPIAARMMKRTRIKKHQVNHLHFCQNDEKDSHKERPGKPLTFLSEWFLKPGPVKGVCGIFMKS